MKQLLIFKDGMRIIGDTDALILPQHPTNIVTRHDLTMATPDEMAQLTLNPQNDELLKTIGGRRKI